MKGVRPRFSETEHFYIFGSRIATHILFWIAYYILFSLIWAGDEGYLASFYLEFVLLPTRLLAVYLTIYLLVPRLLLKRQYLRFIFAYCILLLLCGILQRVFIHLFYENLLVRDARNGLFSIQMLIRATILINTTVFFVLGVRLFQLWTLAYEKVNRPGTVLELRSNRRIHRVAYEDILFVEGLGNYVKYHLADTRKITVYGSVKTALQDLPTGFIRAHKSYIVNKAHIRSFDATSIQVADHMVPRGKGVEDQALVS